MKTSETTVRLGSVLTLAQPRMLRLMASWLVLAASSSVAFPRSSSVYGVVLRGDAVPSPALLSAAIEEVVAASVPYFHAEWEAGREPPCCLECAGIRYVPDEPGAFSEVVGARQILRDGQASCQSAAAYYAARERALALWNGATPAQAERTHRVQLEERHHPNATDGYWHALVAGPDGLTDVTEEMQR